MGGEFLPPEASEARGNPDDDYLDSFSQSGLGLFDEGYGRSLHCFV